MEKHKLDSTLGFVICCAMTFAFLQLFKNQFIYQYDIFLSQPWRWWTAHWVHVGWMHYCLNVLAFACLPFLFPNIQKKIFLCLLLILPPLLSFSFYFLYPQIFAYAGLSGILHGIFIFGAIVNLTEKKERHFSLLIIVIILSKITWEHFFGSLQTEQLIGSPVLTQAHLLGVIFGSLLAILSIFLHIKVMK